MSVSAVTAEVSSSNPTTNNDMPQIFSEIHQTITDFIQTDSQLLKEKKIDVERLKVFVNMLCKYGYADIEDTDAECRSICVTAQAYIEKALATLLREQKISKLQSIFLTPLPPTPFRKEGDTPGLTSEKFESARQHTLDTREKTVRELLTKNSQVVCAYSQSHYQTFCSNLSNENRQQRVIWTNMCENHQLFDYALKADIPSELVGANYILTDLQGNKFVICTQGIQAKDAPSGEAIWKKWAAPCDDKENKGTKRAEKVLIFISQHGGPLITLN